MNEQLILPNIGIERKKSGQEKVASHAQRWLVLMEPILQQVADANDVFTIETVRARAAMFSLPELHHPNALGALIPKFAKKMGLVKCGYVKAKRAKANARIISQWMKIKNEEAVEIPR
jgi:hypothetical protein